MAERAAHLLDHVFPDVPVRQWVLSLPYGLRYQLAWDHDLCRAVVRVRLRAVFRLLRERACDEGLKDGRGGAVAVIQRFGGGLNLNVHGHALVLDGVFAKNRAGVLGFHPTPRLTTLDVAEVLATAEPLLNRRLHSGGLAAGDAGVDAPDAWANEAPVLAGLAAASVQGLVALGPRRGARLRRLGDAPEPVETPDPGHCHARANGFDLHAGLVVPAGQRERLERVCRHALRPPVAQERLHLTGDGQVRLELRHPWRDGTTDIVFDPLEFLGRLAVLVPRRAEVVRRESADGGAAGSTQPGTEPVREADAAETARRRARGVCWAALMQRTFGFDVLACPHCGGRLRLIALIEDAAVVGRILRHLGVSTEIPSPRPARAPPFAAEAPHHPGWDDDVPVFTPAC